MTRCRPFGWGKVLSFSLYNYNYHYLSLSTDLQTNKQKQTKNQVVPLIFCQTDPDRRTDAPEDARGLLLCHKSDAYLTITKG